MRLVLLFSLAVLIGVTGIANADSPPQDLKQSRPEYLITTNDFESPNEFSSSKELHQWAHPFSNNNVLGVQELHYKKYKIFVVYRSHTSGVYSSEPIIYIGLKDASKGPQVYKILNVRSSSPNGITAVIERNYLVLYQVSSAGKKLHEYARFNLGVFP